MAERSHTAPFVNFQSWDQLVAHWPDPVLVFDSDSQRYIVVNDAAARLLGYSRDEILGLLPGDLSHPDDAREIPAVVAQAEREGSVRRPWRARCKDGSIVQTEMTLTRRRIDGRVVSQGIFRVLGPTGGYLMSYPIAALVTGTLAERGFDRRYITSVIAMAAGLAIIFTGGVLWLAWFARPAHSGLTGALQTGLYPFLPADIIKICVAAAVMPGIWRLIGRP